MSRILGVILFSLLTICLVDTNLEYKENGKTDFFHNLIADKEEKQEDLIIDNKNTFLSESKDTDVYIIEYTNKNNYSVSVSEDNVVVNCEAKLKTNKELVENNIRISASFMNNNSQLKESASIKPGETIKIYVHQEYIGDEFPTEDVICNYNLALTTF